MIYNNENIEIVIGLEIHVQLNTLSKLWCGCAINARALENTLVCDVCMGAPGSLPVINKRAIEKAIKAALALNCSINSTSFFDRKNYFYPDLPKSYQITQYLIPIAEHGYITIDSNQGEKKIAITRIQIEEDTGKSTHYDQQTLINLNRSGTPLIEIVGGAELSTPKEASQYFRKIHTILTYIDVTDGNLQEGNLRCDANVSIRKKGEKKLGTRTEIKNLNSFRNVEKAIEVEVKRQMEILNSGGVVEKETLGFDALLNKIKVLRRKPDDLEYRYFPDPDLLPLSLSDDWIQELKAQLVELPDAKKSRFETQYGLNVNDAYLLTQNQSMANYFEAATALYRGLPKIVANWILVELLRLLNESGTDIDRSPVTAPNLASLLNLVLLGTISGKMAKEVFEKMYDLRSSAEDVVKSLGLTQLSDEESLRVIIRKTLSLYPKQLSEFRAGKEKLFGFFVGMVMKETSGTGNPALVNSLLKDEMSKSIRATMDVGSNSTILLIAEVSDNDSKLKIEKILHDEIHITGLGKNLDQNKKFSSQSEAKFLQALKCFIPTLKKYNLEAKDVRSAATEASRVASNAREFFSQVRRDFGFTIDVITPFQEANFTALGVLRGLEMKRNLNEEKIFILDIGGASTEIIEFQLREKKILQTTSFPIGCLRWNDWENEGSLQNKLQELEKNCQFSVKKIPIIIGVAATVTNIASMILDLKNFDEEQLNQMKFTRAQLLELQKTVSLLDTEVLLDQFPFLKDRVDVIFPGINLLLWITRFFSVDEIIVSTFGLRHGLLL